MPKSDMDKNKTVKGVYSLALINLSVGNYKKSHLGVAIFKPKHGAYFLFECLSNHH